MKNSSCKKFARNFDFQPISQFAKSARKGEAFQRRKTINKDNIIKEKVLCDYNSLVLEENLQNYNIAESILTAVDLL